MTHSKHPICAYQAVATGRVPIETFRKKQFYINDFQLCIGEELAQFDAFMRQTEAEFDAVLNKVAAKKEEILRDLQTQRVKLASVLNDIQEVIAAKRYAEAFDVVTELDEYITEGYLTTAKYSLKMFTGKLNLAGISELLDKAVVYEFAPNKLLEEANKALIHVVNANRLRLFHPVTFQMTQVALSQAITVDPHTPYCYIRAGTILCCGGNNHSQVYEINVKTGRVENAPNMNSPRVGGEIWFTKKQIFVFGGNGGGYRNTAEKNGLDRKPWVNITNAIPKPMCRVSVCEHSTGLYLSGFDGKGVSIVHFNLETEAFKLLRYDPSTESSLVCCVDDELYCVKKGTIETANLSRGLEGINFAVKATFPQLGNGQYWLCYAMKYKGGEFVSVLNPWGTITGLFSFTPAKNQFTQVSTFTY